MRSLEEAIVERRLEALVQRVVGVDGAAGQAGGIGELQDFAVPGGPIGEDIPAEATGGAAGAYFEGDGGLRRERAGDGGKIGIGALHGHQIVERGRLDAARDTGVQRKMAVGRPEQRSAGRDVVERERRMQRGAGRAAGEVAAALQRGETSAERERGAQPDDVLDAECERIGGSAIAGEGGAALAEDIEVAIDLVVTAGERGASEDAMFRAGEVQAMTEGGVAGEDLGVEVSFAGGLELVEIVVNLLPRQTDGDVAVSGGR